MGGVSTASRPPRRPLDLSVLALLAANAIPLIGVLFWGWDAARIVFLYWFENVVVGAINVLKIVATRGRPLAPDGVEWLDTEQRKNLQRLSHAPKLFLIPFFVVHYGLFTFVHGVFLVTFFGTDGLHGSMGDPASGVGEIVRSVFSGGGLWAAAALIASHLYSFGANYIGRGEFQRKSAQQVMFAPYGRVVVLHLAILFGGMAVQFLGNPLPLLVLLVAGKTVLDLLLHWRSHRPDLAPSTEAPQP